MISERIKMGEVRMGCHFAHNRPNGCIMTMKPSAMQFSEDGLNKAYKKIKLSELILHDFGFTHHGCVDGNKFWPTYLHPDFDYKVASYENETFSVIVTDNVAIPVVHAHELQNVTYALCGVELLITE
jgi:hypothetical protein